MTLTAEQRANLEKLATYLDGLPADYGRFDMTFWVVGAHSPEAVATYALRNGGVHTCGTAACAAGHGPAAGILVPANCVASGWVNWNRYADQMFCESGVDQVWVFGGSWKIIDNSPGGAAARIRYLLDSGSAPMGFFVPFAGDWEPIYAPYLASVDTRPEDEDPAQTGASLASGAVDSEAGETPNPPHRKTP